MIIHVDFSISQLPGYINCKIDNVSEDAAEGQIDHFMVTLTPDLEILMSCLGVFCWPHQHTRYEVCGLKIHVV